MTNLSSLGQSNRSWSYDTLSLTCQPQMAKKWCLLAIRKKLLVGKFWNLAKILLISYSIYIWNLKILALTVWKRIKLQFFAVFFFDDLPMTNIYLRNQRFLRLSRFAWPLRGGSLVRSPRVERRIGRVFRLTCAYQLHFNFDRNRNNPVD